MESERFNDLLRTLRLMRSTYPESFRVSNFVNLTDLTNEQRSMIEKEFAEKRKIWIENSLYYNYYPRFIVFHRTTEVVCFQ